MPMTLPTMTSWGAGAYPLMAERLADAAELAVRLAAPGPGDRVLDVGCGTGNAALLAAADGASVVGIDPEPALLHVAWHRANAGEADVDLVMGDATTLDLPDAHFSVVLSVFGVMYAPDHAAAARRMARCATAGARIVLTAWLPGSFMPAMGRAIGPYLPPPPDGSEPPSRWGDREALAELLEGAGLTVDHDSVETLCLDFVDGRDAREFLIATAGHVVQERARLEGEGRWAALVADLDAVIARYAVTSGDGRVTLPLDYRLTRARPRAGG
jgi:SAM-dependent methyltransferase